MTDQETTAAPREKPSRAGRNLPAAILTALVLVGALASTLFWWNWGFVLLAAGILAAASVELSHALRCQDVWTARIPLAIGTFLMVAGAYWAAHPFPEQLKSAPIAPYPLLLGILELTIVLALVLRLPRGSTNFVRDAAGNLFILGYVAVLGSTIILMFGDPSGAMRIITYIITVSASDTGGYAVGVLVGKHPMVPSISPAKSWEGFAGSVVAAVVVGWLLSSWLLGAPWWVGVLLGVALACVGTAGDLVESSIKRDLGLKDMSHALPGHGGIMDRLDSLLLAAPVAWLILHILL